VLGSSTISCYRNIIRLDEPIGLDQVDSVSLAVIYFKNGNMAQMQATIKKELASMLSSPEESLQSARKYTFEFVSSIIAECLSLGIGIESISRHSAIYSKIFSLADIHKLMQYLFDFTGNLSGELSIKRSESKNMLISMAKAFVAENLGNEQMSLDMVSSHIGLSSIYFCRLFHKEVGVSFNNYLAAARIDHARKLLCNTNLKVFEVGCASGFGNSKHFHVVFRKATGLTPSEYRNSYLSQPDREYVSIGRQSLAFAPETGQLGKSGSKPAAEGK
jgi:two-component system response regulator YesN